MRRSLAAVCALSIFFVTSAPDMLRAATMDTIFADDFELHPGFTVQTPDILVPAGTSTTWCYYFRTPNTAVMGIKRWASTMGSGLHMVLFTSYDNAWDPLERQPPGTFVQASCGLLDGGGFAAWTYAAHHTTEELVLPADDGSGTPLAFELGAGQPAFLQLIVSNPGAQPFTTSALLRADALSPATPYTKTASYLTVDTNINIPANQTATVQYTCAVPSAVKFWWLSTRTHRYGTQSSVLDGSSPLVVDTAWDDPLAAQFGPPAFHAFSPSGMTTTCAYNNFSGASVVYGENEQNKETCEGVGLFFPAAHPSYCVNGTGPF